MLEEEKKHIQRAKGGNKEAFGLLYDHYLPKIYRFIFLKVANRAEAEDLAHEVFLNAWQSIYRYKDEGFPFSSWLYQIAKNGVIDFYRTSKKNIQLEAVNEELVKINANYPENLETALALEKLQKIIRLLKPEYQDVLIMRFVEDMSHEEIAAILNKSEGAVRLIQHRALKELKSLYEKNSQLNDYGTTTLEA
ncbi:MAG: sigma-70 family RNA polymerase sigma factor [Candidatus Harrisonbacteria bacterium]|nr:sigma-70 family RNA polymerase sigma factor [Candidatus Harrisonbacteria bacterium]